MGKLPGESLQSDMCLVPALGGRPESLGTGDCTKLPKEFGLHFTSQLRAVTPCDVTHTYYLYRTGPPKSVPPAETPEIWTQARTGPAHSSLSLLLLSLSRLAPLGPYPHLPRWPQWSFSV